MNAENALFFNPPFSLLQLQIHKQRQKDLSGLSKGLVKLELAQHLQCWQNLLTAHSLELAELISNLDEEAAADIRKVSLFNLVTWSHKSISVFDKPHIVGLFYR